MTSQSFGLTLEVLWAFVKGFSDSLRGAVDLFLLDSKAVRQKEKKSVQREVTKEILLNRDSPVRGQFKQKFNQFRMFSYILINKLLLNVL